MKWLKYIRKPKEKNYDSSGKEITAESIRIKFQTFHDLLVYKNKVLETIGDIEEKAQGEYLFDINYVRSSVAKIVSWMNELIENMIKILEDSDWYTMSELEIEQMKSYRDFIKENHREIIKHSDANIEFINRVYAKLVNAIYESLKNFQF